MLHRSPKQEASIELWTTLDPIRLAESRLSIVDFTQLLRSLLQTLDIIQQPADLLSALAVALPQVVGQPSDLLECYELFAKLGRPAASYILDDDDGAEAQGVATVLRYSDLQGLQKHISSVFVLPSSAWISSDENVTLQGLRKVTHVLQEFEVSVSQAFVAKSTQICTQRTPDSGTSYR